jgi:hypothetical protein
MAELIQNGEVCAAAPAGESTQALSRACHEIIDAASALMVNVEFLAQAGEGSNKQRAAEDARRSVERIVKIAQTLRGAA